MTPAQRDDEIAKMTLETIDGLMSKLPMLADRKSAAGFILMTGYNLIRSAEDDDFVRGWLESALEDVKRNASVIELKGAH